MLDLEIEVSPACFGVSHHEGADNSTRVHDDVSSRVAHVVAWARGVVALEGGYQNDHIFRDRVSFMFYY